LKRSDYTESSMNKSVLFSTKWYEQRIHLGVLQYAHEKRWDVVSSHHMPGLVFELPDVDGQIVEISERDQKRLRLTKDFKGPVVGLEDFGNGLDIPRVHTDNMEIGKLAAQHFLERNFKNFATLHRQCYQYALDRLEGFHQELSKTKNVSCEDFYRPSESSKNKATDPYYHLLQLDRPLAVFCGDDEDALHLIRFLDREGVSVPEEVAVVGVNDDPVICPYAQVPITSVNPNFEKIGHKAAELLDKMMQGKKVPSKVHLIPPAGVTTRRSSDIRAVDDVYVAKAMRLIWDQSSERITITSIAEELDIPVRTLQWKFSKQTGHSLQDELIRSRVNRVKHALRHSTKSTNQIAEDLDFSSVQYMIRVFSKETGMSPLKYRRAAE